MTPATIPCKCGATWRITYSGLCMRCHLKARARKKAETRGPATEYTAKCKVIDARIQEIRYFYTKREAADAAIDAVQRTRRPMTFWARAGITWQHLRTYEPTRTRCRW